MPELPPGAAAERGGKLGSLGAAGAAGPRSLLRCSTVSSSPAAAPMRRKQKRLLQAVGLALAALVFLPNVGLWSLYRERQLEGGGAAGGEGAAAAALPGAAAGEAPVSGGGGGCGRGMWMFPVCVRGAGGAAVAGPEGVSPAPVSQERSLGGGWGRGREAAATRLQRKAGGGVLCPSSLACVGCRGNASTFLAVWKCGGWRGCLPLFFLAELGKRIKRGFCPCSKE